MRTKLILYGVIAVVCIFGIFLVLRGTHPAPLSVPASTTPSAGTALSLPVVPAIDAAKQSFNTGICTMINGSCQVLDAKGNLLAYSKLLGDGTTNIVSASSSDTFVVLENLHPTSSTPLIEIFLFPEVITESTATGTILLPGAGVGQFPAPAGASLYGMAWNSTTKKLSVDIFIPGVASTSPASIETHYFVMRDQEGRRWSISNP